MENHHFLMAKSTIYINGPCSSSQTVNVYQRISWLVSHNSGYQYHQYDLIIIFMVSIYCYHNIMSIIIMSSMSNRISIPLICHNIPLIYHWYPMVFSIHLEETMTTMTKPATDSKSLLPTYWRPESD